MAKEYLDAMEVVEEMEEELASYNPELRGLEVIGLGCYKRSNTESSY